MPYDAHVVMPGVQSAKCPLIECSFCPLNVPQLDLARADANAEGHAVIEKVARGYVGALGLADLHHRARIRPPDVHVLEERDHDNVMH